MFAPRSSWHAASFACVLALASACGDDDKRETQTSDSAVGATPLGPPSILDGGSLPPGTSPVVTPPTMVPPTMLPPAGELDAGVPELDAMVPPVVVPAPDATVAAPHPLSGRYAVRTVSYARQKTNVAGQTVDVVSKAVLLSVADVSAAGLVNEHLCLIEVYNEEGLATWSSPGGTEKVPDSMVLLERRGDVFVRPLEEDTTAVSWANANRPADCAADGGVRSSGCTCVPGDKLPTLATDCRVRDLDGDNLPGLKLSVGGTRPPDPNAGEALITLQVAAVKAVEWRLPSTAGARVVGTLEGNVEQAQLSVQGELASELGAVKNATCPADTGHVELVRGDFDCTKLLAARRTNIDSYGVFDVALDAKQPEPSACPDPDCTTDSDRDGKVDCMDGCPEDGAKSAAGACGCGKADTDANQNGTPDCNDVVDMCPNDPAKTAPGACGCGVADTNTDGDAEPDCRDACPADAAKTAAGACGCGAAETNTDGDGAPDCTDECDADPNKTAPGVCNCGVPDTNTDGDSAPDCTDQCDADPNKTAPGICNCGVADVDLNGDGTVDCSDACPQDPAKVVGGLCGCGVPDTNTDGDSEPDCKDQCPANPALTTQGACGCEPCPTNPLLGTYAVRTMVYGKSRVGTGATAATTSKAVGYALVTVTAGANGTATMTEKSCAAETIPQENGGAYGWSTPTLNQRLPATPRTLTAGTGGTWLATAANGELGWDSSRQPSSCSASSAPPSGWPSAWGSTCTCNTPAGALPPYDRDEAPYDCRLTDPDQDGQPGITLYVSVTAPDPNLGPRSGLTAGNVSAVSQGSSRWIITPAANGRHSGTVADESTSQIVACRGGIVCTRGLSETPPRNNVCPASLNKVQFVPVSGAAATCAQILDNRSTLFVTNQDGPWPDNSACSPP